MKPGPERLIQRIALADLPMHRLLLLLALSSALLVGCERPFVEASTPTIEVLEPSDLGTVRTERRLPLAFRASSFRAVDRVEVNGMPATYFGEQAVYLDTLLLEVGLNAIVVAAYDAGGAVGAETLYAVYLPYQFATLAAHLPTATGGHAATPLTDGTVLVTGGAPSATGPARDGAVRINARTLAVSDVSARLVAARTGHTASRLPDGRVLLLGGSTRSQPGLVDELVPTAELFDPATGTFEAVPVENEDGSPALPVRRSGHTAAVFVADDGEAMVYLYGGLGPRYDGDAVVPIEFIRTLRFEPGPDRLVAVGPRERFRIAPIAGHTQTPLEDVGADGFGRYLVAGTSLPDASGPAAPFVFTFAPGELVTDEVGPAKPRTGHAAARFGRLVLVSGGRDPATAAALRDGEVFAREAGRLFRFGDDPRPNVARWGHTATNLGDGRILLVGGFSASGDALRSSELFLPR